MYINNKELTNLEMVVEKLQDIIEAQNNEQNHYFIEGIFNAREFANECEADIERIRQREIKKRAKQIVKNRT